MSGLFVTHCTSSPVPTFVLSGQLIPPGAPQHEFSNPVPVFAHSRQAQLSVRFGGMGVQAGVAEVFAELVPKKCLSGQRLAKPCSPSAFAHHVSPLLGRGLAESLMHRNRITPWGVCPRLPQLVPSPQPPLPPNREPRALKVQVQRPGRESGSGAGANPGGAGGPGVCFATGGGMKGGSRGEHSPPDRRLTRGPPG